jgi:hypothetical protein
VKIRSIPTSRPIAQPAELGSSTAIRRPSSRSSAPIATVIPAPGRPRSRMPTTIRAMPTATNQTTSITVNVNVPSIGATSRYSPAAKVSSASRSRTAVRLASRTATRRRS